MNKLYKKNETTPQVACEPVVGYGTVSTPGCVRPSIPDGCMTLDQFAEMFHKKLDDCYAELSDSCK